MRYMRVTVNPTSPIRQQDGTVSIRLNYPAAGGMMYCKWRDGDLVAVPDAEMGAWGGPTDNMYDIDVPVPYKVFQDTVPVLPVEVLALVPLWSAHLRPFSNAPEVLPTVWPVLQVVLPG